GSSIIINLNEGIKDKVIIEIINNGQGISSAEIPFVFNRFYRSDEIRAEISGSGLGLAIAKEIIELHSGKIKVESKPGVATIFTVILPI
ncbi:MAG: ATP-binding protein, partial [Ignavibacteriaceae bacterium]